MKKKRFLVQVHLPLHGWSTKKQLNEYKSAVDSCENLYKKYNKESNTRVFDTLTEQRVYPLQKDKFGNKINPFSNHETL